MRFSYPCEVSRDSETGQVILECKNPSAFAFGDSLEEAVKEMHSLLLDCVSDYIDEGKIFPTVTKPEKKNEVSVELTPSETVKVLFLNSMVETKTKPIQIARRLGIAKQEVTRILNPRQKTKIDTLEKAIDSLEANVNTPVNNGDTVTSVKTGDESLTGMFATIALLSVAGYTVLRKKEN